MTVFKVISKSVGAASDRLFLFLNLHLVKVGYFPLDRSEYMLDFTEQPLRLLPKSTMIMICETSKVKEVIEFLKKEFYTGHIGDGKIFVSDVRNIIRIRTGEDGIDALQKSKID